MRRVRAFFRDPDVRKYGPALAFIFALYCIVGTSDFNAQIRMDQERATHHAQR